MLMTNTDWSDIVLARKNARIAGTVNEIIQRSDLRYDEIPDQVLGAARIVNGGTVNLSFV